MKPKLKIVVLVLFLIRVVLFDAAAQYHLLLDDPLTSPDIIEGEFSKSSIKGEFSQAGWRALDNGGMLLIQLEEGACFEGALSIDMKNLNWQEANLAVGSNKKIHFINMFSNPNGDHHFEDGGTGTDAMWTLRAGSNDNGKVRYGNSFKILWASRGAKRAPGSDYHERKAEPPTDWDWGKTTDYKIYVTWSKKQKKWTVSVNGVQFSEEKWENQLDKLKYIYLGKAADFHSMVGPYFCNLKVYEECSQTNIVLKATHDFSLQTDDFAPFYRDRGVRENYVAINPMKYEDKWACAKTVFQGEDNLYDITIITFKEFDGESAYRIKINEQEIADFQNPRIRDINSEADYDLTIGQIKLSKGDTITVESKSHSNKVLPEVGAPGGYAWSRGRWKHLVIANTE